MQPLLVFLTVPVGLLLTAAASRDEQDIKFADCPAAVRKSLEAEAKGAKIETVTKETNDDEQTVFWAEVKLDEKQYAIGVLEDGTLSEFNLAVDDADITLDRCPAAVQLTLGSESFGEKIKAVGKDMKYGVLIFETVVEHKGRSYQLVVADDGTLVEKVLVIADEEVTLEQCPPAVRITFREHAKGGKIGEITRSTGIGRHTFEAEVQIKDRVYLVEVGETGHLISKSLEAVEE
jgi:hypothetical protein